jgi:hypothetical protein
MCGIVFTVFVRGAPSMARITRAKGLPGSGLCSVFRLSDASGVRLNDALRRKIREYFAADCQSDGDRRAFAVFFLDPKQIAEKRTFNQTESAGALSLRRVAKTAQKHTRKGAAFVGKRLTRFGESGFGAMKEMQ